jgi:hypothetical protein
MDRNPSEQVRKLAEDALNRLSAELEAGRSEALKTYLTAMGRFHRYSWGNVLLINAQRPSATRVAGFHTWHDLGRAVKKGEKGIMIFAPVVVKREPPDGMDKTMQPFRLAGFRTAYVFDVAQTDGRPLPAFASTTGDPGEFGEKLKATAAGRGISVEYDGAIAPAQGLSSGGRIRLLPGLSKSEEFSVLAHELAHEMLHQGKNVPELTKVVQETQAEAVAFVVCRGVGLETSTAASDYIALYNGDKATLAESLAIIQRTSAEILDQLLPQERTTPARRAPDTPGEALPDQDGPPAARAASEGMGTRPEEETTLTWDR